MTNLEIIFAIATTLIGFFAFMDKINNRKKDKKEIECREHTHKINNMEMALQAVEIDKVGIDEFNEIKSKLISLQSEMENVKRGIARIESLIMEKKL